MSDLSDMRENLGNAIDDLKSAIEGCEHLESAPKHDDVREAD